MTNKKKNPHNNCEAYECVVLTGANAAAIKLAYDTWNRGFQPFGNMKNKVIVSCTMFGVTDLIVFYYVPDCNGVEWISHA